MITSPVDRMLSSMATEERNAWLEDHAHAVQAWQDGDADVDPTLCACVTDLPYGVCVGYCRDDLTSDATYA